MRPRLTTADPLPGFVLHVRFADGASGDVDLSEMASHGVFAAWNDPAVWAAASIDPLTGTVVWPGGLDLDPDCLYRDVTGVAPPGSISADRRASA